MYEPNAGPTGVNSTVNSGVVLREYEDIDNPGPNRISQPSDLRSNCCSQISNPHDMMRGYDIPLRVCI